jgi:hypothetical protein
MRSAKWAYEMENVMTESDMTKDIVTVIVRMEDRKLGRCLAG